MADIVAMGELLVDFLYSPTDSDEPGYKQNAGGSPANVACMASKLGAKTAFIGKIGRDMFGFYLKDVLRAHNVDISGLILDPNYVTTLTFINKNADGLRDYVFYRSSQNSADLNIRYGEIKRELIDGCRIFHFGTLTLTSEPARTATMNAAEYAKMQGKIISYTPNWRPKLWDDKETALRAMKSAVKLADIVKVSEAELQLITDCGTLVAAVANLLNQGVKIICITQGAKGCIIATQKGIERYPFYKSEMLDTLGAGDCFLGAFLCRLSEITKDLSELDGDDIKELAMFANACGSLSSSKKGAIASMPTREEIIEIMKTEPIEKESNTSKANAR